ncbi:MAG: nagA [Chlamydiales bacterium]|jgi:beta-N-acetylhexosaminidase|nr:nagA [Chlamydiales bacterium]
MKVTLWLILFNTLFIGLLQQNLRADSHMDIHIKNRTILRKSELELGNFDSIINKMTLDEKIGQLFMAFFYGENLTAEARQLLEDSKLGNIILYNWANGLEQPQQVKKLTDEIQTFALERLGIPAFISVDQEMGIVARLKQNFTEFPGNMALAATQDPKLAKASCLAMAREMGAVGINWNLAPVVDINDNPHNPVIGVRSFGDQAEQVITFGKASLEGFREAGIVTTLKHYPGHGNTSVDSHEALPCSDHSLEELLQIELKPFIELHNDTDAIMTGHILFRKIDPNSCASLSPVFLRNLLKDEIGFKGIVVSDALVMKGVAPEQNSLQEATESIAQAAIKAFLAGSDCLILGRLDWANFADAKTPEISIELIKRVIKIFKEAVLRDEIREAQIDDSLGRILKVKQRLIPLNNQKEDLTVIRCQDHLELANQIAERALTLVSPPKLLEKINTTLKGRKVALIAPDVLKSQILETLDKAPNIKTIFFNQEEIKRDLIESFKNLDKEIQGNEMAIFCSFNGHVWKEQLELLQLLSMGLPPEKLIIIGMRNPQDMLEGIPFDRNLTYLTYSPTVPSLRTVLQALEKKRMPIGVLPMSNLREGFTEKKPSHSLSSFENLKKAAEQKHKKVELHIQDYPLTKQELQRIGEAIWQNEGAKKELYLTHWNKGEEFPSFGIAHFIWLPANQKKRFKETFPDLLKFMEEHGVSLPSWLQQTKECPWETRDIFIRELHSQQMKELRHLLKQTTDLQTLFIARRLKEALPAIQACLKPEEQVSIKQRFETLIQQPNGLYALLDYVNFKGEGTTSNERYKGKGWGLLQVLLEMKEVGQEEIVAEFTRAAKFVLKCRIQNSPKERGESRWLKGWENRLDTYSSFKA